jgi:uncharacterized protein
MMNVKNELRIFLLFLGAFGLIYFLPVGIPRFDNAVTEALELVKWYAREHVILCLLPAFLIAGAVGVFVRKESVMKYLGAGANRFLAYGVASLSGTLLAVCSCTILPLFAGIHKRGAGLGPAIAFLYSGPAINVLAIILTARILGPELGIARAVGAIVFSVVIGIIMSLLFPEAKSADGTKFNVTAGEGEIVRPLWVEVIFFTAMMGVLIFVNWGKPLDNSGLWGMVYSLKWIITAVFSISLAIVLVRWFGYSLIKMIIISLGVAVTAILFPDNHSIPFAAGVLGIAFVSASGKGEQFEWFESSWDFAKQIFPLLLVGVMFAGFALGRPGHEGIIPSAWISSAVGGNSLSSNFFAAFAGAFMYFATLTEVPIVQGLIGSGMGKGPALALLLAGPALSLPSMLVIKSVLGTKKTVVYAILVIIMATFTGMVYGKFF